MKRCIVTGAAGFLGSNLCDYLLEQGIEVIGIDNLSRGRKVFLESALRNSQFEFHQLDLLQDAGLADLFQASGADTVIHLASNADVRFGLQHPRLDLEQGLLVTHNVLEATRLAEIPRFCFSSTGSVYGEPNIFPTPEDCPFPLQTSLYAAAKLSAEAFIQAYAIGFGLQTCIFRFVSLLGARYTHGHVFDFVGKLRNDPKHIEILGDGGQTKSYLSVSDCVRGILQIVCENKEQVGVYNLGTDEYVTVDESLDVISACMGVNPERSYAGGKRGWVGDSPFIFLDCSRARTLGWKPQFSIRESIESTVAYHLENPWLFEESSR